MDADDGSLWIENLDIPAELLVEVDNDKVDDSYRSQSIEELPSRMWRTRTRPPPPPPDDDEAERVETPKLVLDLSKVPSTKSYDTSWASAFGTTFLAMFVGFILYQKLSRQFGSSKVDEEMARQRTEDARARRLARVPEGYGIKKRRSGQKKKVALPEPEKYLPKADKATNNILVEPTLVCSPVASDTNISSASLVESSNETGTARDFALQMGIMASLDKKDCDDDANSFAAPGFHHIPGLPNEEYAKFLLRRLSKEFSPIIQRRGFKILAVSEMCCCTNRTQTPSAEGEESWNARRIGDGDPQDTVLGYNRSVSIVKLGEEYHEIFVRLRTRRDHAKFRTYGEIDTTMAHELAHCVHPNHSVAFYQTMAEIQQEHYKIVDEAETSSGPANHSESVKDRFGYDIYKSSTNGA